MSASQVVAFSTNTVADNQTRQLGPVSTSNNVASAQQAFVQAPCREAGTFDRAYVTVSANTVTAVCTFRFRVNTSNGNQSVSIGSTQTGEFEDITNSDTLTATDAFNFQLSAPNTVASTSITVKTLGVRFTPTDSGKTITWAFGGGSGQDFNGSSTTTFTSPSGSIKSIVSEDDCKSRIPAAFTSRNLTTYVATNARTNDTTVRTRINGADGNQSLVFGAAQTGLFEDITNSDSLAAGNDYAYSITTGSGTQVANVRSICTTLVSTEDKFLFLAGAPDGVVRASTGSDGWFAPSANMSQWTSTEADAQIRPAFPFTLSGFSVRANANTSNQTQAVKVRRNGADSALGVSITAGSSGLFQDSDTENVAAGDTLSVMLDLANAGTGNISFHQVVLLAEHPSTGGSPQTIDASAVESNWNVITPAIVPGAVTVAAPAAAGTWNAITPAVTSSVSVAATSAEATWVAITPSVAGVTTTISAPAAAATSEAIAPTIAPGATTIPATVAVAISEAVTPAADGVVTISTNAAAGVGEAVTPSVEASVSVAAPAAAVSWQINTPDVLQGNDVLATGAASAFEAITPSVVPGAVQVAAAIAAGNWEAITPTAIAGAVAVTAQAAQGAYAAQAPGVAAVVTQSPLAAAGSWTALSPGVDSPATVVPPAAIGTFTALTPSVTASVTVNAQSAVSGWLVPNPGVVTFRTLVVGYASRRGSEKRFGGGVSGVQVSGGVSAQNKPGGSTATPVNKVGGRIIE